MFSGWGKKSEARIWWPEDQTTATKNAVSQTPFHFPLQHMGKLQFPDFLEDEWGYLKNGMAVLSMHINSKLGAQYFPYDAPLFLSPRIYQLDTQIQWKP